MKNFITGLILIGAVVGAIIYFTGNTDKAKAAFGSAVAKSKGYTKEVAPEHIAIKTEYETSLHAVDKNAVLVRDSLKQGTEATEAKSKLREELHKFSKANAQMNKFGYLHKDQYIFNRKRIRELSDATK